MKTELLKHDLIVIILLFWNSFVTFYPPSFLIILVGSSFLPAAVSLFLNCLIYNIIELGLSKGVKKPLERWDIHLFNYCSLYPTFPTLK